MFNTRTFCFAFLAVAAARGVTTLTGVGGLAMAQTSDPTPTPALATEGAAPHRAPAPDARFHADVEIDPTAYVLGGYSLHVGLGWRRVRADLGAFAMALPGAFLPSDDFDVSFNGFGAKLQFFPFAEQHGGFVGADAALTWQLAQRADTELAARDRQVVLGVNAGWRFALGDRFYVTPWIGLGRVFGAREVTLGGSRHEPMRTVVFPAIHVGYRVQ